MVGYHFFIFPKLCSEKLCEVKNRVLASYQDVQTGGFEQSDLICDGERHKARQLLSKLHRLYDALCREFTELVPEVHVQSYTSL